MNARKIYQNGMFAWAYATICLFLGFIVGYSISHVGFLRKGFEMFFGVEPRWDWNDQLKTLTVVYFILIVFIFAVITLQEWQTQRQLRKIEASENRPLEIVGKVRVIDITHLSPNMTKRQMEKWLKDNPQCEKVIEPKDIFAPSQLTPMKESDIVSKEELNNFVSKNIVHNGDFSEFKADSWGNEPQTIPPIETELYINNEPIGKHLTNIGRLLTEAINLSYVSGDNTKAQMRDKIIEARRITEEIKRIK